MCYGITSSLARPSSTNGTLVVCDDRPQLARKKLALNEQSPYPPKNKKKNKTEVRRHVVQPSLLTSSFADSSPNPHSKTPTQASAWPNRHQRGDTLSSQHTSPANRISDHYHHTQAACPNKVDHTLQDSAYFWYIADLRLTDSVPRG